MTPIPPITNRYELWAFVLMIALQAWTLWMKRGEQAKLTTIESKQDEQHKATNGRLEELLRATRESSRAEGKAEGIAQERAVATDLLKAKQDRLGS